MKIYEFTSTTCTPTVQVALWEAKGLAHACHANLPVQPIHLLLALEAVDGLAHSVLKTLNTELAFCRAIAHFEREVIHNTQELVATVRMTSEQYPGISAEYDIPAATCRVLDLATEEADRTGAANLPIGEEHILMAFATLALKDCNHGDADLQMLFARLNIDPRQFRSIVLWRLGRGQHVSILACSKSYLLQVVLATVNRYFMDTDFDTAIAYTKGMYKAFEHRGVLDYGNIGRVLSVLAQTAQDLKDLRGTRHWQPLWHTITETLLDITGRVPALHIENFESCVNTHIETLNDASSHHHPKLRKIA